MPGVMAWKSTILDGLGLGAGVNVLDLGCGAGDDALDIAARLGPGGHVTGVDFSEFLIAEAIRRASGRHPSGEFRHARQLVVARLLHLLKFSHQPCSSFVARLAIAHLAIPSMLSGFLYLRH